jgi:hypothetical protein
MRNSPLRGFMKSPLKQKLALSLNPARQKQFDDFVSANQQNRPKVNAFAFPDFTKLGDLKDTLAVAKTVGNLVEKVTPKTVSSESNSRANKNRQNIINKQTKVEPTTRGSKGVGGGQYRETF